MCTKKGVELVFERNHFPWCFTAGGPGSGGLWAGNSSPGDQRPASQHVFCRSLAAPVVQSQQASRRVWVKATPTAPPTPPPSAGTDYPWVWQNFLIPPHWRSVAVLPLTPSTKFHFLISRWMSTLEPPLSGSVAEPWGDSSSPLLSFLSRLWTPLTSRGEKNLLNSRNFQSSPGISCCLSAQTLFSGTHLYSCAAWRRRPYFLIRLSFVLRGLPLLYSFSFTLG